MRPVLIKVQERPGGLLALTYSLTPGNRVTIVAPAVTLTEQLAEAITERVAPLIGRARTERITR